MIMSYLTKDSTISYIYIYCLSQRSWSPAQGQGQGHVNINKTSVRGQGAISIVISDIEMLIQKVLGYNGYSLSLPGKNRFFKFMST